MNTFHHETAEKICAGCRRIGESLDSPAIRQAAGEAEAALAHPHKLRVAFLSQRFAAAAEALEEAFGFRALPETLTAGQAAAPAKLLYVQGNEDASGGAESLKEDRREPVVLTFSRQSALLGEMDAELLYSPGDFTEFDWKRELAEIDYICLAVSAVQMLTASERRFVERWIKPCFGLARFAVVLTGTELVNSEEDYQELQSRLNWYLGSLGQPCASFETGCETLAPFVRETLLGEKQDLRDLAAYMTAQQCCQETRRTAEEMLDQTELDLEALDRGLKELRRREAGMRKKGDLAASTVRGELMGGIQYNAARAIQKLFRQMCDNICETVDQSQDLEQTRRNIPRFIETAVRRLDTDLQNCMAAEAEGVTERMEAQMRSDAGEFFTGIPFWMWPEGKTMMDVPLRFPHQEPLKKTETETEERVNRLSKALLIGTLPVMILGSLPLAVGTLAGSQLVKAVSQKKILEENREALKKTIHDLCAAEEQSVQEALRQHLEETAANAERQIQEAYGAFVSGVLNELSLRKERAEQACAKKEGIVHALEKELPQIEALLETE